MRQFILGAAIVGLIAGTASAADLPVKAVSLPAPVANWAGGYIGVNGGGVWGRSEPGLALSGVNGGGLNAADLPAIVALSSGINNSGGLAGGQVGYLWQEGSGVYGFEASFDWMNASGSTSRTSPAPGLPNTTLFVNQSVSTSWLFTFAGRLGWDMGAWFPYVTGGLAAANLKYNHSYADNFPNQTGGEAAAFSSVQPGFLMGGGLEWRFDRHWSLRAEGLFIQFTSVSGLGLGTCAPAACGQTTFYHRADFSEAVARGMVSYKF